MRIPLQGCLNFRDVGGYRTTTGQTVRTGILFRSDGLHHLTPGDVEHLRDTVRLGEIVDLRSSGELRNDGRGLLESEAMAFHHIPLFDGDTSAAKASDDRASLADRYFLLAEFAKDRIGQVLSVLANGSRPAVYHCAAGKDRTGVISAILLGLLGVEDGLLVADYALSSENLDAIIDRLMQSKGYREMFDALPPETLHANPETMEGFLRLLRERYGTMDEYAMSAGLTPTDIAKLRGRML